MSRLDYITIAIVAACILAIIFLVYKMTDLFSEKPVVDPIEVDSGVVEQEDSTTYDYNIEDDANTDDQASSDSDNESTTGEAGNDDASTTTTADPPATTSNDDTEVEEEDNTPAPSSTTSTRNTISQGKYMVIAGAFTQKKNARAELKRFKSLGYSNAVVSNFDRGKYDVIIVDRFGNMADAERLVNDLKAEGIRSYVKAKQAQ